MKGGNVNDGITALKYVRVAVGGGQYSSVVASW